LVSCRLETGRQHQIRIHLSEAGTPLLGEPIYVRGSWLKGAKERARRPMLHAVELGFVHPGTRKELRFTAEPPPDFARLLATLESSD
jgi:23S rRNA pseudouridine1911/1915/1917 synthase